MLICNAIQDYHRLCTHWSIEERRGKPSTRSSGAPRRGSTQAPGLCRAYPIFRLLLHSHRTNSSYYHHCSSDYGYNCLYYLDSYVNCFRIRHRRGLGRRTYLHHCRDCLYNHFSYCSDSDPDIHRQHHRISYSHASGQHSYRTVHACLRYHSNHHHGPHHHDNNSNHPCHPDNDPNHQHRRVHLHRRIFCTFPMTDSSFTSPTQLPVSRVNTDCTFIESQLPYSTFNEAFQACARRCKSGEFPCTELWIQYSDLDGSGPYECLAGGGDPGHTWDEAAVGCGLGGVGQYAIWYTTS